MLKDAKGKVRIAQEDMIDAQWAVEDLHGDGKEANDALDKALAAKKEQLLREERRKRGKGATDFNLFNIADMRKDRNFCYYCQNRRRCPKHGLVRKDEFLSNEKEFKGVAKPMARNKLAGLKVNATNAELAALAKTNRLSDIYYNRQKAEL